MLKQAITIPLEDLADKLHNVSWHNNYISACCPYHDDSHASLLVYEDGYFRCLACGVYGSHAKLEKKLLGKHVEVKTEKQPSPPWLLWEKKYKTYEKAAREAYNNGKHFPSLLSYLRHRNLYNFVNDGAIGWLDGWLSFPVFDADGDFCDWVVRSHPKMMTEVKYAIRPRRNSQDMHLYCPDWDFLSNFQEIFFPFGILDAWSIFACDLPVITGITGQLVNADLLKDIRKTIYIIPDAGELAGAIRLQQQLDWRGQILQLAYPDGCKDSNDVLMLHGVTKLKEIIMEAKNEIDSAITR